MKKILIFIIFLMANNGFAQIVPWDTNGTTNMRFDNYWEGGFLTIDNTTYNDRILVKIKGRYNHNRPSYGARTTNYPDISLSRITSEPGNISKIQIVKYGGNYAGIKDKFSFKAPNNLPVYLPNTVVNEMFSSQTIARFSQEVAPSYCQPANVCTLALPGVTTMNNTLTYNYPNGGLTGDQGIVFGYLDDRDGLNVAQVLQGYPCYLIGPNTPPVEVKNAYIEAEFIFWKKCPFPNTVSEMPSCPQTAGYLRGPEGDLYNWVAGGPAFDFTKLAIVSGGSLEVFKIGSNGVIDKNTAITASGMLIPASAPEGMHRYLLVRKDANGCRCKIGTIFLAVHPCDKCLYATYNNDAATNAGNIKGYSRQNQVYLCSSFKLSDFQSIILKYDCAKKTYGIKGYGPDATTFNKDNFNNINGFDPISVRPACNSCGGLKDNMYAFAYRKPIAINAPNAAGGSNGYPFDYVIDPRATFGDANRWKAQVESQAGKTVYNIYNTNGFNGSDRLFAQLDLKNNMAYAPAAVTVNPGVAADNEMVSSPNAACAGSWNPQSNIIAPTWSEKLKKDGGTPMDCRTYEVNTWENNQVALPGYEKVRVKVCNPCNWGLFTISNADLKLGVKGTYTIAANRKILGGTLKGSATAAGEVEVVLNKDFLPCLVGSSEEFANNGFASSIVINRDLPCSAQTNNGAWMRNSNENIKDSSVKMEPIVTTTTFPNPFTTELNIKFTASGNEDAFFEVFDIQGKKMYNSTAQKQEAGSFVQETLDTANWAAGMYIIKTYGGNGESSTQKIIKQ